MIDDWHTGTWRQVSPTGARMSGRSVTNVSRCRPESQIASMSHSVGELVQKYGRIRPTMPHGDTSSAAAASLFPVAVVTASTIVVTQASSCV